MIRTAIGNGRALGLTGAALAALALTGCNDGPAFLKPADDPAATTDAGTGPVERDVEAPDVFSAEEAALWDGRPSLGGVWVAHPDVTDPQRVRIRNTANGKEVIGALFRRERDVPGPRIQVSSDAAEALSMLAGAPVRLSVVALVREESPAEPAPDSAPAPQRNDDAASPETEAGIAVAAVDAAPSTAVAPPEPAPEPRRGFRWPWSRSDPVPAAAVPTAAPAAVETEPLAPAAALDKPYVQIGIFSVQENAERAAGRIRAAGLNPAVHEQSSDDRKVWRVVVGPARTATQRTALLQSVEDSGFSDAYFVTN